MRMFYLYRSMCDTLFFLMDMEQTHQPLWNQDLIYSRWGGGGVSMLFNLKKRRNFSFGEKKKKLFPVTETSFF